MADQTPTLTEALAATRPPDEEWMIVKPVTLDLIEASLTYEAALKRALAYNRAGTAVRMITRKEWEL